jgi:tRNA pseudouridine38-40 synthase
VNKYKIVLEYDGTNYSGWQAQKNAKSIQGTLIDAAQKFLNIPSVTHAPSKAYRGKEEARSHARDRHPADKPPDAHWLDIQGAGRTDAGVHALGQVAHLECARKLNCETLRIGMNDLLPAGINLLSLENAHPRFHARHSAVSRSYLYLIAARRTAFGKKYVWWVKDKLHIGKMRQALDVFQGFHDFSSFADKRMDKDTSTQVDIESVALKEFGNLIALRVAGSHFLWKMVRRIVGMTVEAGRGNVTTRELEQMLQTFSDAPARFTAPPSGLFLEKVLYEGDKLADIQPPICLL